MKKNTFEIVVGVLVILFSVLFVMFTMKITNKKINEEFYRLYAVFDNIEGVNIGTKVKIGGIEIGEVEKLGIDKDYKVQLSLKIKKDMLLPIDSNIKIATSGLIGGKYLRVDVGGEEEYLNDKDSFEFTESTMDLEDMITRFMLNKVSKENEDEK
ncbi:MAG: outer membrane lipid asymmetry maintenance protein MlaD [Rickettsiales bacterium]|nr:outer membrane lipid asymmetry maintenance protein MlaD [Rickettsiales bacterium]